MNVEETELKRSGKCFIHSVELKVYDFVTPILTRNTIHNSPVDLLFPIYSYIRLGMAESVSAEPAQVPANETVLRLDKLDSENVSKMSENISASQDEQNNNIISVPVMEENNIIQGEEKEDEKNPHFLDPSMYHDEESMLKHFYVVDASTSVPEGMLDAEAFLAQNMSIQKMDGPQILIYHTHSQEAFADSVVGDENTSIVGVGEYLKDLLEAEYGFNVLHHTESYDVPDRNKAYSKAKLEIEKILQENPSIQLVIDLHRDAMPEEKRLITEIDGKPTAKIMFFNGLSRLKNSGEIGYLKNDNLGANLAISFQMEKAAMEYYPDFTRKIYLKSYRYNMHLKDKYLLVELGAQNNTLEEAMNACEPLAHLLSIVVGET